MSNCSVVHFQYSFFVRNEKLKLKIISDGQPGLKWTLCICLPMHASFLCLSDVSKFVCVFVCVVCVCVSLDCKLVRLQHKRDHRMIFSDAHEVLTFIDFAPEQN